MPRPLRLILGCAVAAVVCGFAAVALAEDEWPYFALDPTHAGDQHTIVRGSGRYLSMTKFVLVWLLVMAWVKTADWLSRDCWERRLNHVLWNSVMVLPFLLAFMLLLVIPIFPLGYLLLLIAYGAPFGTYVYFRNAAAEPNEQVFTPAHVRRIFASKAKMFGVKVDVEKKAAYERGAAVELTARGGATDRDNNANLLTARQSPGFVIAKDLIAESVRHRAEMLMMDYTAQGVAIQVQVDGVWHPAEPRDRETSDLALAVMKTLAAQNPAERAKKQAGVFDAAFEGKKYVCRLLSQGTETGERVVLRFEGNAIVYKTFAEIGLRQKLQDKLLTMVGDNQGFVLFSSLPGGGLSTLMTVSLLETDRLMRSFVAIEDQARRETDIENVEVTTINGAAGETPAKVLPQIIRKYPDVIVVRDLADPETVKIMCEQVEEKRLMLGGIRAKEAAEALLRVLMLKVPATAFAPVVRGVVNVRLVRKLCPACKVAYEPAADMLKKLGIPEGRVSVLYRDPRPDEREAICTNCGGYGFAGRTGIYELLIVDDAVRDVLLKQPKLELLKKAARKGGSLSLQDEGLLLVVQGETSLNELSRVLKQ